MRTKKVFAIVGFIIVWTFFTYFLLCSQIEFPLHKNRISQLNQLRADAQKEYKKSESHLVRLMDILKAKYYVPQLTPGPVNIVALSGEEPLGLLQPPGENINLNSNNNVLMQEGIDQLAYNNSITKTTIALPTKPAITRLPNGEPVIPILVFACNRISISKCLNNLVQYRPSAEQFPIIVSQDCGDEATKNVILSFKSTVSLIEQPDQSDIYVPPKEKKFKGYYKIARHYGWALNTTFHKGYEFVVIVEDDLNIAPDFFEYFLGTHKLLKQDPTLWCVSAWNDNGKANFIDTSQPELLYRTDFFPGLGWMLTKELWQELSVKWPKSFWDDWIRHPEQRKDRVCIRPEISRTQTFGKIGVSNGLFFDKYLKHIKLSEDFVKFTKLNLSYLLKENYDRIFLSKIYTYPIVTYDELRRNLIKTDGPVRIQYTTSTQYKLTTRMLGLMDDFKSGVPRTGYHGIVSFYYQKRRVYLAPNANWKGYDLSWS
ncbi:alpha-1,3-mannosyl-glycoprotein 2-beta-N-acetylglucosaminyltransferase-like [Teleopsis dalmanni]|uniref:alpha-1,3-mannosyl-glycoprotein 2-beta-N-acetylglucosaminyltransferase-like n=1 Tax=Teleopsis dalmanni TaxID=139649 RepID=UPI0018CD3C76|nr:alpha-1,3-mannosyl-glycoprotein 2-beta-N-acetylglucosaminyltransferase-like [Teleopsis dalmanni]XP_037951454.1 alpha-1,3-mannosyl-glycoprotein 2-beta-N-acetylglucosaminyltransferase-like [Teleopsis dalmanni]